VALAESEEVLMAKHPTTAGFVAVALLMVAATVLGFITSYPSMGFQFGTDSICKCGPSAGTNTCGKEAYQIRSGD